MKVYLLISFLTFWCNTQSVQASSELLKVSLYYESLCPYSIDFINKTFYPAYQKIGSFLQVAFVPYGNANHSKVDGEWKFDCQHGEEECWGNKAQACGLEKQQDQDQRVDFVNCIMGQDEPASKEAVNECAPKLNVTADAILQCIEGTEGGELLAKYGDETNALKPKLPGVPYLIFNDKYNKFVDSEAIEHFLEVACVFLPGQPDACPAEINALDKSQLTD